MVSLGLTGGIGSGKSAVARMFAAMPGVRVIIADDLAKDLMQSDTEVRKALEARFGTEVFSPEGTLNRSYLANRAFGDEKELSALNAIVHPAVRKRLLEALPAARRDGVRLLVYEAALIFESGADEWLDAVAVVDAPDDLRIERAMRRDATPRAAVEARMRHQLPREALLLKADHIISNEGDLAQLETNVRALYDQLVVL